MPSFRSTVFAIAAAFVATAQADYIIDPKSVRESDRKKWCLDQKSSCPLICKQTNPPTTLVNTCDYETLTYGCVCGTGLQPNISEYSLTIPFYTCQEWGTQCVAACGLGNNQCADSCRKDHPCGAQSPSPPNATVLAAESSSSSAAKQASQTSAAPNTVYNGKGGDSGSSSSGSGATAGSGGWEGERGRVWGTLGLLGCLVVGFGML